MDDLLIRQKIEAMIQYGYIALRQFPKSERHVLSQEIRLAMLELLKLVIICNHRYYKKTTLQDLDATLDLLRSQIRLAKDLEFLPFRRYEIWSRHLDEIGRMVGGWFKSLRTGEHG